VRWLLLKDLQILRRSPFLVAVLIAYPIIVSVLIGLALSRGPDKPKVAVLNQLPAGETSFTVGGQRLDVARYARELFKSVDPVAVHSRQEAIEKVRSGEALGALIVPADATRRLQDAINLSGTRGPTLEVLYNVDDPIRAQIAESTIRSRLADANKALSDKLTELAARYLQVLLEGGDFSLLGQKFDVLGLQRSKAALERAVRTLPAGSAQARDVQAVIDFTELAIQNLGLSDNVLTAVGQPLALKRTVVAGHRTPLDAFAVAVSVTVSLMFVTVLLASGMLALEREEHAFGRLVRGLVSRLGLLGEKVALAAVCAVPATLIMLCGIGIFVHLDWGRFALWVVALAGGAVGFGALGVAVGALARDVRAASLLAFLLTLPIAFLALVPAGTVAQALYDVIRAISALFPFRPALQAVDAALNGADPGLPQTLAHLGALAAAYLALARVALARSR
jgi:ABC-type transport system involved in cytochrome c biogenesis permease component